MVFSIGNAIYGTPTSDNNKLPNTTITAMITTIKTD